MDLQPGSREATAVSTDEVWPGWTPRAKTRTRLLLIDDHPVVREGLAALLSLEPDLEVAGTAASIAEGIELVRAHHPDLVISDLTLPGTTGSVAVRKLVEACPDTRVLVLSVHDSLEIIRSAFNAGAVGYVRKDASRDEMLYAIRRAAAGGHCTCLAVRDIVVKDWLDRHGLSEPVPNAVRLSDQDRRVLRLIALGVQTWRIAEELSRGVKAVEKYRAGLMQRFGLKNAAAVTRFALEMHLLSRQEVDRMLTPSHLNKLA
jgi:DNA-binding NarL/FixJ family response regulator